MSTLAFILDPSSQNSGTELNIGDGSTYRVQGMDFTPPPLQTQYVSGIDTDGDTLYASRYQNRVIGLDLLVTTNTAANLKSAINALQRKAAKINRDAVLNRSQGIGGTFGFTNADGTVYYFDVCEMVADVKFDLTYEVRNIARVAVSMRCLPLWRGAEVSVTANSETTLPVNIHVVTGVTGDAPGLCRLIATDAQGANQAWCVAGMRSRNYNAGLAARLFYQAESLTPLGGSAATAGSGFAGTASGSSVIDVDILSTSWEAVLSTNMLASTLTTVTGTNSDDTFTKSGHGLTTDTIVTLSAKTGGSGLSTSTYYYVVNPASTTFQLSATRGGTAVDLGSDVSSVTVTREPRMQHTGGYRVFARVQSDTSNNGTVGVCFEWGVGDFRRPTRNSPTYLTSTRAASGAVIEDEWIRVDLGLINIPPIQTGPQFWEGRVLACSTSYSDQLFIDELEFVPVDEFYSEVSAQAATAAAPANTAYDDFKNGTYSGDLAGDTLPLGGAWGTNSSPYETDDFVANTSGVGYAERSNSSADTGTDIRYGRIVLASTTTGMTNVGAYLSWVAQTTTRVKGRGLILRNVDKDNFLAAYVDENVPGTLNVVKVVAGVVTVLDSKTLSTKNAGTGSSIEGWVSAAGEYWFKGVVADGATSVEINGQDSVLATGGALAAGYTGMVDWRPTGTNVTRQYDTFICYVPTFDAAIFANQSLEFRWDGWIREDSTGGFYQDVNAIGDPCLIPPAGAEGRSVEVFVKACRNNPRTGTDPAIDDLTVQVKYQPRGLVV